MTKGLLTGEDIKNYIYQVISETLSNKVISKNELKIKFKLSDYLIRKYISLGMPYIGNRKKPLFEYNKVSQWLQNNEETIK